MPSWIQIIGILSNVFLLVAFYPQLQKLIKTKNSEGISMLMWGSYLIGDVLALIYAISINDTIVTMIFTAFTIETIILMALTHKYRNKTHVEQVKIAKSRGTAQEFGKKEEASKEEIEESEYRDIPHQHKT